MGQRTSPPRGSGDLGLALVKAWAEYDALGMLQQLGARPAPGAPR
jgi:hypothetical protein